MIELYAITDDPAPPAPPLRAVQSDGLTALCAPAEQRELTAEVLWEHEAVVESLMEERDLLPMRFGTLVEDDEAAVRALEERREELRTSLDRVRGAVELAVRVEGAAPHEPTPNGATGAEYIRAKAHRTEAARLLHEPLAFLARESVVPARPRGAARGIPGRPRGGGELRRPGAAAAGDARGAPGAVHRPVAALQLRPAMRDKVLHAPPDLDLFPSEHPRLAGALSRRVNADPESVEKGLAQLVLTIVELLRQLMERQALRRIDGGSLSEEQVERLGQTFMELDRRMEELREEFGLTEADLNLDLGPLGRLL